MILRYSYLTMVLVFIALTFCISPELQAQRRKNKKKKQSEDTQIELMRDAEKADTASVGNNVKIPSGPVLQLESERYSFGNANQGDVIRHTFRVKNIGDQDLLIRDVKPSCGCTIVEWPRRPLQPGESAQIDVRFNTAGKMGEQKKAITIHTNMPSRTTMVAYIEGIVLNPYQVPAK